MGQIIASCGHDITSDWFSNPKCHVVTKGFTRENKHCTDHQVVCSSCRKSFEAAGQLLETPKDQAEWINHGPVILKGFREQFIECSIKGYNARREFESFESNPGLLPAFPNKKMIKAIKSGELKGIEHMLCDRFGGRCTSKNPGCQQLRGIKP